MEPSPEPDDADLGGEAPCWAHFIDELDLDDADERHEPADASDPSSD